jgi:serine/threonine protein kinase
MDDSCKKHIKSSSLFDTMNRIANYEYREKIGQGAFGTIYKGRNVRTGELVVIKMEPLEGVAFSSLKHESTMLNLLYSKSCRNIPPTYWYGTIAKPDRRILVMPFYRESLVDFVKNTQFDLSTFRRIMCSAISILNHIHDKYVVHRDIKPANWMIHNDELILIDFGLASFYVDANERHITEANPRKEHIIGTPKYASWNVHCGEEYSRRDDLMSMVYVGLFLLSCGELWYDLGVRISGHCAEDVTAITHPLNQWFKMQKDLSRLKKTIPSEWNKIKQFAEKVYSLSFQERPSYKEYIEVFKTI